MEQDPTTSNIDDLSDEQLALIEEQRAAEEKERAELFSSLSYSIEAKFQDRAQRRSVKETEWLESARLYYGSLGAGNTKRTSDRPFPINTKNSRPDVNIVRNKCNIAIAQCVSMQFAGGEKNWDLYPSVDCKYEDAEDRALKMAAAIETQLEKCQYGRESRRAITDMVIMGSGILKGPVNTGKVYTKYEEIQGANGSTWVPKPSVDHSPSIEYVNPWFFYPDDTVNDFQHSRDSLQAHPKSPIDLKKLMTHPGFISENIAEILKTKPAEYRSENYSQYASLTDANPYLFTDKYIVVEYHGPITATQLAKLEIEPAYESVNEEYYGEVWVCQGQVIRLELENIEASYELPYAVAVWEKDPSSVFGYGAPQLMRDAQRVVTETWHMILDNASISSGPQVAMHKGYIEPADNSWELNPRKAWYLTDPSVNVDNAIQFFYPPNVIDQLMPVMDAARTFAEEESMTPMLAGGMQSPENSESATGTLILRQASTTLLDFKSEEWDDMVTEKIIRRMYGWNMQYNPDPYIKGNYSIDVRSSTEYKNKQMHLRDMEKLSVEATQNQDLGLYVNMDELTRARLAMMKLPSSRIVRTPEEVQAARTEAQQQQPPNADMLKYEVDTKQIEIQAAKLALEQQRLQFEATVQQQREVWEHEEKMSANFARLKEAEAMVIRTQNEKELELLQIASRMEESAKKSAIIESVAIKNNETKVFLKSMEETRKQQEAMLTAQELAIKKRTGSGI